MSNPSHDLSAIFDEHVGYEFVAEDVAATMAFTHDVAVPAFLPNVAPTGRRVRLPVVVVMGIDEARLPITGAVQADKVLDKDLPANTLLRR